MSDEEIESRHVPSGLMVNRQLYLAEIRNLMIEWNIRSEGAFDEVQPRLVRHALYRMGKLP